MNNFNVLNNAFRLTLISSLVLVAACSDNNNPEPPPPSPPPAPTAKQYQIEVINLTHNQPFSPIAAILHSDGSLWQINQQASVELEIMAESGDNSELLGLDFISNSTSGTGVVPPGNSESLMLETTLTEEIYVSIATMLVNTNDAFTGASLIDVTNLQAGDSLTLRANVYDAGTEGNTEAQGTIPGPADGGEGYNAIRDDINFVTVHPGVITQDDGLITSVLDQAHRFDNPASSIQITRIQ